MFLKRLETVGFKSFAERIKIEFVSGVTGVVGPNGSGKSNVIDAIRWVLWEQSAKSLRGSKMEDVIFQGSDSRKALNFAEVSLILNNEAQQLPIEYQEVNVTRRVYRSGESEFYINKQACRLKDIVDLFMDTGLGKESFSIIGQGKIDEILSSKAEDRRAVFEEAAGVLKYKKRKRKAEFKLMETNDNLDRVKDIIHEIKQQMDPLKEQANKAEKYQTYEAQLQKVDIALLVTEIDFLHKEWQTKTNQLEESQLTEVNMQTNIQGKEAMLTKHRQEIVQLEEEMSDLQRELLETTEQLEKLEGERNVLLEREKHVSENRKKLELDEQQGQIKTNEITKLLQSESEQIADTQQQLQQLQTEITHIENQLAVTPEEIDRQIEELKSDYIESLNEQAVIQNNIRHRDEEGQRLTNKYENQKVNHQDVINKMEKIEKEKSEAELTLHQAKEKLSKQYELEQQYKSELDKEREQFNIMQEKLFSGNEKIASLASRKKMLEEMRDSFQGFYYGAKEILKEKKQHKIEEILGAVIDLVHIPPKYITAMETVLGGQTQFIVVETDEVARKYIQWLKTNNRGRATFLPLQSITMKEFPSHLRKQLLESCEGFLDLAVNLVETEPKYQRLKQHLLGNVIVAEDLKSANQIATMTNRRYRVITLDGDIVRPGGSMTGGAKNKNKASLFTREKEITQLETTLLDFRTRAQDYEAKIKDQKENVSELEKCLTDTSQHIENWTTAVEEAQSVLQQVNYQYTRIENQLNHYYASTDEYEKEKENLQSQSTKLKKESKDLQARLQQMEEQMETLTNEKANKEADKKHLEQSLQASKIQKAEIEERKKAQDAKYRDLEGSLEEQKAFMMEIQDELRHILNAEERKELVNSLRDEIETLKTKRIQLQNSLENHRQTKETKTTQSNDEENEVKGLQYELSKQTKLVQKEEIQVNRLDVTLENNLSSLQKKYRTTFERASMEHEKVANIDEAKATVDMLKTKINHLGTVNLGAIEEYNRISERFKFLNAEQNDLLEASNTLFAVIKEMDEEMTKRFSGVFYGIQQSFTEVFKQLFGGGYAELHLTNPEDMLGTGIEIIARPPGKKLKSLELLSGGERALTAIALLFAILDVRPVPFCILDEVDAALDESNVERFGKYLNAFSQTTQFIVITHRKGTMAETDALYGVTMQESGVSRLVSVKLEETKQLAETT